MPVSSHLASRTKPARQQPDKHRLDKRMLAQQQVRLLAGMTRLLSRLLHRLLWEHLHARERHRAILLLARLENDLALSQKTEDTPSPPHGSKHP